MLGSITMGVVTSIGTAKPIISKQTNLGYMGGLGDVGDPNVRRGGGQQQRASRWFKIHSRGCIWQALQSSIDICNSELVVLIVSCQHPNFILPSYSSPPAHSRILQWIWQPLLDSLVKRLCACRLEMQQCRRHWSYPHPTLHTQTLKVLGGILCDRSRLEQYN